MKCFAPWHSITVRFNGDIVPCCVYKERYGNVLKTPLNTVLDSVTASYTKDSFRNGVLPPACQQCTLKEESAGHSRRLFFRDTLNPMLENTNYDYSKNFTDIYFLEFNMSNICNLKCRMCSGLASSAWVKDDIKLHNLDSNYQRPVNSPEFGYTNKSEQIIERLFEDPTPFMNLQYLSILGGEPYMEPANKIILQKFIDLGIAKNITLDWTTNGTIVDEEVHELAKQFGQTKWNISVEGTEGLYEYIRGGKNFTFAELNENLKQFNFATRVIITTTVMAYNIAHLDKLYWWFEENKQDNWEIYFTNVVVTPPYLNPQVLPNSVLDKIDFRFPNIKYTSKDDSKLLDTFVKYTKDLDKIRNENVLDYCPELSFLFK